MSLEQVISNNLIVSIIIRKNYANEKDLEFFTKPDDFIQFGFMRRNKGHIVKKHFHNTYQRTINKTQEVIFLKKGSFIISFFNESFDFIEKKIISAGDIVLILSQAHEIEMIEDCEFHEVKNGPFDEKKDKTYLT
jgi:hypothetical protein